jgi:hypothetical protein
MKENDKDSNHIILLEDFYLKIEQIFNSVNNKEEKYNRFLRCFVRTFEAVKGVLYIIDEDKKKYIPKAFFACSDNSDIESFEPGDTLPGQVVIDKKPFFVKKPENYSTSFSGLGKSVPEQIALIPIIQNNFSVGIIEVAFFKEMIPDIESAFNRFSMEIGEKINL